MLVQRYFKPNSLPIAFLVMLTLKVSTSVGQLELRSFARSNAGIEYDYDSSLGAMLIAPMQPNQLPLHPVPFLP
jgi:hypothetical protein